MKLLIENWRKFLVEEKDNYQGFLNQIGYSGKETIFNFDNGCQVKLVLLMTDSGIEINLIEVLSDECMRKGYASMVMEKLINAADEHSITLFLQATPINNKIGQKDLLSWYGKYGFAPEDSEYSQYELIRLPRGLNNETSN